MDKYDRFMQEMIAYLQATWLAKSRPPGTDRGAIRGSTESEIEEVEQQIGKKLPAALKAWYRVAGAVPPYLNDHDADFSLEDLKRAQETAVDLVQGEDCDWELTDAILPFSQRMGGQFLFVDTSKGNVNDPPVFLYVENEAQPYPSSAAFTCSIREKWLIWLDFPKRNKEVVNQIGLFRENWMSRKRIIDTLRAQVLQLRNQLIETIHQEDLGRDVVSGPRIFQERWLQAISSSEIKQKLLSEGLEIPFNWIETPPDEPD